MHPCISKFPNEKFYDKKIIDGSNVREYHCTYLPGSIFGPYSFMLKVAVKSILIRVSEIWLKLM